MICGKFEFLSEDTGFQATRYAWHTFTMDIFQPLLHRLPNRAAKSQYFSRNLSNALQTNQSDWKPLSSVAANYMQRNELASVVCWCMWFGCLCVAFINSRKENCQRSNEIYFAIIIRTAVTYFVSSFSMISLSLSFSFISFYRFSSLSIWQIRLLSLSKFKR